jgi:hypothetical protein
LVGVVRGLVEGILERGRMGLVVGTTLGCVGEDRRFDLSRREAGGRYVSPGAFSRTLPSTVAAEVALALGLVGPSVVVSAGAGSAAVALRRAAAWMEGFGLAYCLAGGVEEGRVAMMLLGREGGMGEVRVEGSGRVEMGGEDLSLGRLAGWIEGGGVVGVGAGVWVSDKVTG